MKDKIEQMIDGLVEDKQPQFLSAEDIGEWFAHRMIDAIKELGQSHEVFDLGSLMHRARITLDSTLDQQESKWADEL